MGKYYYKNSKHFPFGIVYVGFDVAEGRISDVSITGDFFGEESIDVLCGYIKGCFHTPSAFSDLFNSIDISHYISGATASDIIGLFF